MNNPTRTGPPAHGRPMEGRLLWCALVPLFALVEAARRLTGGLRRENAELGRRDWLTEARTQASIATSYALMARALLH